MQIGSYKLANNVIAAPMAGVSDKPFRQVCLKNGAGMAVSEMVTSRVDLHQSTKTRFRLDHQGEAEPRVVQIVGTDPQMLATAARYNVASGAQIIDINMGCPAKKVCQKAAGSALLSDEPLVEAILRTVVDAVDVPVTVKIRTGANPQERNGVTIAKIAEQAGIQAITVHGRTRQCKFVGNVEYDTIASIKNNISIPVIANGDIDSPEQASLVLKHTLADAVMVGRAAQGQPWLFAQIAEYLNSGTILQTPALADRRSTLLSHIKAIHNFYGPALGIRFARKHIKWYLARWDWTIEASLMSSMLNTWSCEEQLNLLMGAIESPKPIHSKDSLAA